MFSQDKSCDLDHEIEAMLFIFKMNMYATQIVFPSRRPKSQNSFFKYKHVSELAK